VLGDTVHYYTKFGGATALVRGHVVAAPITTTHADNIAVLVGAIGGTTITATYGATVLAANYFAEGTVTVGTGTGIGQHLRIRSNLATSASGTATIYLYDALPLALSTTSVITLRKNPYDSVEITAAAAAGVPVGVTNVTLATATEAGYFGWLQTWGPGPGLAAAAGITVDTPVRCATTAGGVEVLIEAGTTGDTAIYRKILGWARCTTTSAGVGIVDWRIRC